MSIDRARLAALAEKSAFHNGRYHNINATPSHGLRDFLRWQLDSSAGFPPGKRFPLTHPDAHQLAQPGDRQLTWIGHSSFLFQHRGLNVLTDPVFSERASPFGFAGPIRYTPAALQVAELPHIHLVLISHNHYDHLDDAVVRALYRRFGDDLCFAIPEGLKRWFGKRGITNVVELGWWQSTVVDGVGELFCLPTQHFSGRGAGDRNATLWCSWLLDQSGDTLYFAGDTGYGDCFADIGQIFSGIDLALLPIGAYDPRWFMSPVHVAPEEAVHIHRDIRARQSVAMHWGTFVLTDEPMDEPPRRLHQALLDQQVATEHFVVMQHGETRQFGETLQHRKR